MYTIEKANGEPRKGIETRVAESVYAWRFVRYCNVRKGKDRSRVHTNRQVAEYRINHAKSAVLPLKNDSSSIRLYRAMKNI